LTRVRENDAAANQPAREEGEDRRYQHRCRDWPNQLSMAGLRLSRFAEETADGKHGSQVGQHAHQIEKDELAKRHAALPGHRRCKRGQARHKFGDQKRGRAAANKRVFGLADADRGLERELAQDAQDMMPVLAPDEEPGGVGDQRPAAPAANARKKLSRPLAVNAPGGEQHRRRGHRQPELLHQYPGEEHEISIGKKNVIWQSHHREPFLRA